MIVVNIYYTGEKGKAKAFAQEMIERGLVEKIQNEAGNLRYEYFLPLNDETTILLIDVWENQEALDIHHQTPMMQEIIELRQKYNLTMKVERFKNDDQYNQTMDQEYIRV